MQITLLLVFHVSIYLAGTVVTFSNAQTQSYPTGLRDDEDFASPGSGSGAEPPIVEPPVQSSGSEPIESASKAPEIATTEDRLVKVVSSTTSSSTTSTTRSIVTTTTTTTTTTTKPPTTQTTPVPTTPTRTAPLYEVFTGVIQHQQTTAVVTSQLDDSCLPVNYIPTYPWPVKIYCNRESNTLRAICVVGQPPQTCYCVDPLGGSILYDVVYPNCGPVTPVRTSPAAPVQPTPPPTTTVRMRSSPRSTVIRLTPTTHRAVSTPRTPPPTTTKLTTTTMESFKIDQETLDARAETTRSWDQGVPVIATFMGQPGLLAAIICGAVVGLLTAVLLVMFLVYRMRKKDEGSYVIEEPSKRMPLVQPYERTQEYYA